MSIISQNLKEIRKKLDSIRPGIRIVGVIKEQPIENVQVALANGLNKLGVNYIQEGRALKKEITSQLVEWHFIGKVQTNKLKQISEYTCVHTLARPQEAKKLNDLLPESSKVPVMIEVNVGDEKSKSGVNPKDLPAMILEIRKQPRLHLEGFMCLPPPLEPVELRRPFFRKMKELAEKHRIKELSMGTSEDYLIAAEEGATLVRLGTCLFGPRPSH